MCLFRAPSGPSGISAENRDARQFVDALLRIRRKGWPLRHAERNVTVNEDTLFRADIDLACQPDRRRTTGCVCFLTRNGAVIDKLERRINVRKAGLEQFVYQSRA